MKALLIVVALVLSGVTNNTLISAADQLDIDSPTTDSIATGAPEQPCPPDFHGVPADQFQACFDYWTKQGRWPVTLSAFQSIASGKVQTYFSGSFQPGANRPVRTLMTSQQLQQYFDSYLKQGFRPEQKDVLETNDGPLFTVIWAPNNSPFESRHGLTQEQFITKWKDMQGAGWVNIDVTPYREGKSTMFSAVWVKRPTSGYATYIDMTDADYRAKFDQFYKAGYRLTRFVAYKKFTGDPSFNPGTIAEKFLYAIAKLETRYAAIWEKMPGGYYHYYNLTQPQYKARYDQVTAQGFHLSHVSTLGDRVSAIWVK